MKHYKDKTIDLERMLSNYIFVYELISCKNFKIVLSVTVLCMFYLIH
jgi:hypothetical protein